MKTLLLALLAVGTAYAADPVKLSLEDFTDANGGKPGAGASGSSPGRAGLQGVRARAAARLRAR